MQPCFPNASVTKREYHGLRQRLHSAQIEDRLTQARHDDLEAFADRPQRFRGYCAVDATLGGYSYELRFLLQVSRHVPAPSGRLTNLGPRSHALRCQIAQNLRKRQLAATLAASLAQVDAHNAKLARAAAASAHRAAA